MLQLQDQLRKRAILEGSEDPTIMKKIDEAVEV